MQSGATTKEAEDSPSLHDEAATKVTNSLALSAHHLMLNPSMNFKIAWDVTKQEKWCTLTYLAIFMGVQGMNSHVFKTIDDLFVCMGNFRAIIGTILGHRYSIGWFRNLASHQSTIGKTYIQNDAPYQDSFSEFEAQFNYLLSHPSKFVTTKKSIAGVVDVSLFSETQTEKPILYQRTMISKHDNEYTLYHIPCNKFETALQRAKEAFTCLQITSDLSKSAKRHFINEILFSYAETMPLVGGNAAATQMMFHVLEKHYTNEYTYFDLAKSNHDLKTGYPFDFAAMLATDFCEFEKYLQRNILSSQYKITEPPIERMAAQLISTVPISREALCRKIEALHQSTFEWYNILSLAYREVCIPRQYNPFIICSEFEGAAYSLNALKTIAHFFPDDSHMNLLNGFFEEIAATIVSLHKKVDDLEAFKTIIERSFLTVKAKKAPHDSSSSSSMQSSQIASSQPATALEVQDSAPIKPYQKFISFTLAKVQAALKRESPEGEKLRVEESRASKKCGLGDRK